MNNQSNKPKKTKRWLRFSLRSFLIVVVVFCFCLAWFVYRVERQRTAVRWIEKNGGRVNYDYQVNVDGEVIIPLKGNKPPGPSWLRELVGIDYFSSVKMVYVEADDVKPLRHLWNLESLALDNSSINDISPLTNLSKLETLDLGQTNVSDISPLKGLSNLVVLVLDKTQVEDLRPIYGSTKLRVLMIRNTPISDEELKRFSEAVPSCKIYD